MEILRLFNLRPSYQYKNVLREHIRVFLKRRVRYWLRIFIRYIDELRFYSMLISKFRVLVVCNNTYYSVILIFTSVKNVCISTCLELLIETNLLVKNTLRNVGLLKGVL